jgi:hypothetical protein
MCVIKIVVVITFHTQRILGLELTTLLISNGKELICVAFVYVILCFSSAVKITVRSQNLR